MVSVTFNLKSSFMQIWINILVWLQNATQKSQKVFVHVPSEIAAHEVEEIGMLMGWITGAPPLLALNQKNSQLIACTHQFLSFFCGLVSEYLVLVLSYHVTL